MSAATSAATGGAIAILGDTAIGAISSYEQASTAGLEGEDLAAATIGGGLEAAGAEGAMMATMYGAHKVGQKIENRREFNKYMKLAEELDVSTDPDTAVFYSGKYEVDGQEVTARDIATSSHQSRGCLQP